MAADAFVKPGFFTTKIFNPLSRFSPVALA
jgi:hypothetical protein